MWEIKGENWENPHVRSGYGFTQSFTQNKIVYQGLKVLFKHKMCASVLVLLKFYSKAVPR